MDSAFQGQEGLARVQQANAEGRPYALAFVDGRMPPGWDGVETITKLREVDPALQFVICTAYSDYSWIEIQQQFGPSDSLLVLKKPFDLIEVRQLAHALSHKWLLAREVGRQIGALDAAVACRTKELREANAQLKAEIAERARAETALLQSQKMDAIGQLAAGIAHDFNNILTVVRGHTSLMLERPHLDAEIGASLREVSDAAERATSLAGQLLAFSRKQRLKPRPFDANETVEAWRVIMASHRHPVALVLSRQALPTFDRAALAPASGVACGAYVLADARYGEPDVILIASGSEVALCLETREVLAAEGIAARVVSMPSWELFEQQDQAYRDSDP